MTIILRLPAILALLALVLISLIGAVLATVVLTHLPIDLSSILTPEQRTQLSQVSWVETGLRYGAGVFFLIAAVRLIRRTQGFWTWLLGFACYGGRWAWQQQSQGDIVSSVRNINPQIYLHPQDMLGSLDSTESQVALLAVILIVGLIILIIDAADRAHWDRQGA
ncbi:MAG TPA: hypothetical protein VHC73_00130 [Vitreimonas sp.]|jgi:hypothetical protein|nr:hypothetical protein [Vitreimonas sp.]